MKKLLFASVLLASTFCISCSSDDDSSEPQENTSPNVAELAISNESGLSVDLTWNEVVDPDGDVVTYDLFANGEIVEADLTTVDFVWTAEGQDVEYPVVFTVVSKDENGGESTSNEVELDDPVIGFWLQISLITLDEEGEVESIFENTTECSSNDNVEFMSNGTYITESFIENFQGVCEQRDIFAEWENLGNGDYLFPFEGVDSIAQVVFEGDTVVFTSDQSIQTFIKEQN